MRRSISGLLVVVLTGALLVTSAGVSLAASSFTFFNSNKVMVPGTGGYKLTIGGYEGYVYMDLIKNADGILQEHSYSFEGADFSLSKSMDEGAMIADLDSFGKVNLRFDATEPMKKTSSCGGKIIVKKRKGTLKGTLRFKPDTQGTAFFKTIKLDKFTTTMTREINKDCMEPGGGGGSVSNCPRTVALFTSGPTGRKRLDGSVLVDFYTSESATAPATSISHRIEATTDDPMMMTYTEDLQMANVDFSFAAPLLEGELDFTATEAAMVNDTGTCKGGKTWVTDGDPGTLVGSVTAQFDSFGEVTTTPTGGYLQRWVTSD